MRRALRRRRRCCPPDLAAFLPSHATFPRYRHGIPCDGEPPMQLHPLKLAAACALALPAFAHAQTHNDALDLHEVVVTATRTVTREDVDHFATFTGDTFYAHTDEQAAAANPLFGGIVAHGYLILSFAAGLFVEPAPGPVLANTGLENLRFQTPLYPGDSMRVELTVKSKSVRDEDKGEVHWAVYIFNQKDEVVATYDLLTMNVP
ncbi:MAG: MaoC family dehydratase N-terminal domain-containing protein [Proteobacteria bacterium]|nr:MaoC family dehydratase N-terminal domain-containing protein [Pseudomonadota bacterium]